MKPHIWFRLDSRAFCLSCDAAKLQTLLGQPCPGRPPETEPTVTADWLRPADATGAEFERSDS